MLYCENTIDTCESFSVFRFLTKDLTITNIIELYLYVSPIDVLLYSIY